MIEDRGNQREYSVSELSGALKRSIETEFAQVRVRGELSGVKLHSSGHLYLALKDEGAALDGVCWRGVASKLAFRPEDGLEVIATGRLSTYPARSKYQLVIEHMEPAGAGALMALLEERKKRLAAEGLFDRARKRPLPYLPGRIGIVTSPTGAVIRDILHRLRDRFPRPVLLWPTPVQGEGAAEKIAAAIAGFNRLGDGRGPAAPDLIILARGGGSIEDLWCFNEEIVVRAIAQSRIPIISAVGHETDTTLADLAADLRAPTPTAAAELAVPVRSELIARLHELGRRAGEARRRLLERKRERLRDLSRALPRPRDLLGLARQRLDDLADRLPRGLRHVARDRAARLARLEGRLAPARLRQLLAFARERAFAQARALERARIQYMTGWRERLARESRMLETMSYKSVLARGYAILRDAANRPIAGVAAVRPGEMLDAELRDGHLALVAAGRPAGPEQKEPRPRRPSAAKEQRQGRLL